MPSSKTCNSAANSKVVKNDIRMLRLIQGANGILNGKVLRFKNEPVRHKTLDLIGDLALLGVPIKGHVTAARAGHASNVEFVKKLKKQYAKELAELWTEKIND